MRRGQPIDPKVPEERRLHTLNPGLTCNIKIGMFNVVSWYLDNLEKEKKSNVRRGSRALPTYGRNLRYWSTVTCGTGGRHPGTCVGNNADRRGDCVYTSNSRSTRVGTSRDKTQKTQ